ncbi:MAG: LON peptidase substrate-binding domain-containing protein [Armatimonadota bacterium]
MRTKRLSIMPMFQVLFPGMPMPLDLWEDRYIKLARQCSETDTEFGIVLIEEGKEVGGPVKTTYKIGTTARVAHTREMDDHTAALVVGQEKFRIVDIVKTQPVMQAAVEMVPDMQEISVSAEFVEDTCAEFGEYMTMMLKLVGFPDIDIEIPDDPNRLSYMIAAHLRCGAKVRQELLEMDDPRKRLGRSRELMQEARDEYRVILAAREEAPDELLDGGIFSNN